MPGKRRSKAQMARDRTVIGELYLRGLSQAEIRAELVVRFGEPAVSQPTISRDLAKLDQAWLSELKQDLSVVKARENARLELLIREHWAAWQQDKNPAHLAGILRVIHFRSKLFRLEDHTAPDQPSPGLALAQAFERFRAAGDPPEFREQFRQWDIEAGFIDDVETGEIT